MYFHSQIVISSVDDFVIKYGWNAEHENHDVKEFKSLFNKFLPEYELVEVPIDKSKFKSINDKKNEIRNEKLNKILDNEVVKLLVSNFDIDKNLITFEEIENV